MEKTILVTGATGKVGQEVINALRGSYVKTRAGLRDLSRAAALGVEGVAFDFNDMSTWSGAFDGVDALYFVTPPFHPREAEIGRQAIAAAIEAGIRKIVKLSAMGTENAEGFAHKEVDDHLSAYDLDYTILKPNFYCQNFSAMHSATIKATGSFYASAADGKTSFIDTRDIAAVAAKALTQPGHEGKEYELTGPDPLDNYQVASLLSEAAGREITYVPVSPEEAAEGLRKAGFPEVGVRALSALMGFVRAGYTARTTDTVKEILGRDAIHFSRYAFDYKEAFK